MISIITPAFNTEKYIGETIKSVQNQTFRDWELIIVDDCSTDNTIDVALSFAKLDNRIRVIKAISNGGVAKARNLGLENAKGEYIAFVDSDDFWKPTKLQKQFAFMQEKKYILTYTDFQIFRSLDGTLGKVINCPDRMTANDILKNTAIGCLTVMIDKKQAGEFRMPNLKHTEDNCTWFSILEKGYTAYKYPEVLSFYRVGNLSLTNNKGKCAKQQWETYRGYYQFSIAKSIYYYIWYAINAILRRF